MFMTETSESKKKALLAWSSGKDSAWCLHKMRQQKDVEVVGLLTTLNDNFKRVAMHATREALLDKQAEAIGLPLWKVGLPWPCTNEIYEQKMSEAVDRAKEAGITHMAFGDLFLEDVRDYRIRMLKDTGLTPLFPIWCGQDATKQLAQEMLASGVEAVLTSVDPKQLDPKFAGRKYDQALLDEFPESVDHCGEKGEFHSFCYAGPIYNKPIPIQTGEVVERDGFWFADVLPGVFV